MRRVRRRFSSTLLVLPDRRVGIRVYHQNWAGKGTEENLVSESSGGGVALGGEWPVYSGSL
jgi:hypothetical protein